MSFAQGKPPLVLLVEHDPAERGMLGRWLEEAGFDVVACPGPSDPEYNCIAGRGLPCPLATDADAVVLNLRQATDEALRGMPGWQLMLYYIEAGKQVVVLTGADDAVTPRPDDQVQILSRPADRDELLGAVHRAVVAPARSA